MQECTTINITKHSKSRYKKSLLARSKAKNNQRLFQTTGTVE